MAKQCFWNQITIGSSNCKIKTFLTGGNVALATATLTTGSYYIDELLKEIQFKVTASNADFTTAKFRPGITTDGNITITTTHTTSMAIEFPATYGINLRDLLGFTGNLSEDTSYLAPRKIRGAFYPKHELVSFVSMSGRTGDTVQTQALSGKTLTTLFGVKQQSIEFNLTLVDNKTELQSPTGFDGTSYLGTGITEYNHAEWFWYDSSQVASQGWNDGRPVRFFPAVPSISTGGVETNLTDYSEWIFQKENCSEWSSVVRQMFPPKTTYFSFKLGAKESL